MVLLRLLFILAALVLVLSGGMYIFTQDRRYLLFAGQVLRFTVFMLLTFVALFVLERYVLAGWGILL